MHAAGFCMTSRSPHCPILTDFFSLVNYWVRNKRTPTFIIFWNFFQGDGLFTDHITLHILRGYIYSFFQIFQRLRLFKGLRLFRTLEYTPFLLKPVFNIIHTFSENSNYGRESLLEVIRQNIAGWCQQTFCFQKFVDKAQ